MFAARSLLRSTMHRKMRIEGPHSIDKGGTCIALPEFTAVNTETGKPVKNLAAGKMYKLESAALIKVLDPDRVAVVVLEQKFLAAGPVSPIVILSPRDEAVRPVFYFTPLADTTVAEFPRFASLYISG